MNAKLQDIVCVQHIVKFTLARQAFEYISKFEEMYAAVVASLFAIVQHTR